MAVLNVVKGSCPGQVLELQGERMVLGRHPSCEIVLDDAAVSRQHAQIVLSHGDYFLEDLGSRNGTYLNGVALQSRTLLHEADEIKVCDVVFRFYTELPSASVLRPRAPRPESTRTQASSESSAAIPGPLASGGHALIIRDADQAVADQSSILGTLDVSSGGRARLSVKPEAKLRAVLEISSTLGKVLKLDDLFPKTLDCLFRIFPQADEGFVLLKEPDSDVLAVRAAQTRSSEAHALPVSMTIVRQAMQTGQALLSADAAGDLRFGNSDSLAALQIHSLMCVPLIDQSGAALGVIQISTNDISQQFSHADLDVLASVTSQVGLAVENAMLHEEVLRQRDLERDLEFATQVQLGFLPNEHPKLPGYAFFDHYEAAHRIGGDYFDYVPLADGNLAITLGDVAGKGVPAALLMARLYASARYQLLREPDAARALTALNAEIATSGLGYRFITFLIAILDPRTHAVSIANAGHLPPILCTDEGRTEAIGRKESGMPMGILPDQKFQQTHIDLAPGSSLLFYTDGVTEAMNAKNDIYGRRRLSRLVARAPRDAQGLVQAIVDDVRKFSKGRPQRDDMCLVGLHRLPVPPGADGADTWSQDEGAEL